MSILADVTSLLPSQTGIIQDLAASAAAGVILSGLKAQSVNLDPLGLFHNTTAANNPNAAVGPTITASAFSSLPPASQASFLAAGGHIVAG